MSTSRRQRIRRAGRKRAADRFRLPITLDRAVDVAEVRGARIALHVADAVVGRGQFLLQLAIIAGFAGEAVEILERLADDQQPRGRGSGQRGDRVVEIEQERCRKATDIREAPFGSRPLGAGDPRLPAGGDHAADERKHDRRRGGDAELATPHESWWRDR